MISVIFRFFRVSSSLSSMRRSTRAGTRPPRRPENRIRFSGRRGGRVPARVLRRMEESEELTRKNRKMTLIIALNYGGRAELVDAARGIAQEAAEGRLDPDKVDEKMLARH